MDIQHTPDLPKYTYDSLGFIQQHISHQWKEANCVSEVHESDWRRLCKFIPLTGTDVCG